MRMKTRRKDDVFLKSAFEETFPDLLRFYFDQADSLFDMDKGFQFLDKELRELFPELENGSGNRFVDMLVRTYLKDGTEEWILLHIEIEGRGGNDFPHRMLQYWYRIYDRYRVDIGALAVFTGGKNQKRPGSFHKAFLGTEITYKYNVYHILDHTEQELLAMDNPFALVVLAAQKALNPQINRIFDKQVDKLTGKENTMGIIEAIKKIEREEGIEKGLEQKSYEVVSNLLNAGKFTVSEIANFANVSEAFVRKVKKERRK